LSTDFGTLIWDLSTGSFGIGASYERSIHDMFAVMGHIMTGIMSHLNFTVVSIHLEHL
jgi:hypothetical protein